MVVTRRDDRLYDTVAGDQRTAFGRDRDTILYSSAFRRLAGITEIVRAGEEDVFHTRQQHTIKVAQVGRRLAEWLLQNQPYASKYHGMDAEVVEAACLAHDLGHPPFGHAGEHALDKLVTQYGDLEGYEGNAQTFRIVTQLAQRFKDHGGLNLTRATMASCLKYPWMRDYNNFSKSKKWSAFKTEAKDFEFARANCVPDQKTAEAELMDWADDIAYSVHDLEDFHRCGALNWGHIFKDKKGEELVAAAASSWFDAPADARERLTTAFDSIRKLFAGLVSELLSTPYEGLPVQRQQLRSLTSTLTNRYFRAIRLANPFEPSEEGKTVIKNEELFAEILVLKQITKLYIINNPALMAQQRGQARIIEQLFEDLLNDSDANRPPDYLPVRLRYFWNTNAPTPARMVADCISSLTETEATRLHARIRGLDAGSVLDPIVR